MRVMLCAMLYTMIFAAASASEIPKFDSVQDEKRYQSLVQQFRCLVCQNQTIAESNAELAEDMRLTVAAMVRQGAANEEVAQLMTDRYGDFVLYRPPFKWHTAALWLAPFILALFLFSLAPKFFRRRPSAALDDARKRRAAQLLEASSSSEEQENKSESNDYSVKEESSENTPQ